jgi:hypothetical protein
MLHQTPRYSYTHVTIASTIVSTRNIMTNLAPLYIRFYIINSSITKDSNLNKIVV